MLKTVLTCVVTRTADFHLVRSASTLLPGKKRSNAVFSHVAGREMSQNTAGSKTPSFQPFWPPGSGYYGETIGKMTKTAIDICEDYILSHIDSVPVSPEKTVFTIADYGTCDGSASQQLIPKIIDQLRKKHGPNLNIQILYEDQPSNDFNSLFKLIYNKASYTSRFHKVFPLVCGTSFYKQCLPDNSCDVIISSNAAHWLSEESEVRCRQAIFPSWSTAGDELRAYHEVCARDWQSFLLLRAAELGPGGLLIILKTYTNSKCSPLQAAMETAAGESPAPDQTGLDLAMTLNSSWNELYAEGVITKEEFEGCAFPVAVRTLEDIKAPFEDASPVRQAGLQLLREPEEFIMPCFPTKMWRQKLATDGIDDRDFFANILTRGLRVAFEPTFRNCLVSTRSADQQTAITERVFEKFRQKVAAANPATFQSDMRLARLVARKSA